MEPLETYAPRRNGGAVMVIAMIVLLVISSLAVSIAAMSGTNVQLASNQHKTNRARACAESGFDIVRYWLSRVSVSGSSDSDERLYYIASSFLNELSSDNIRNITLSYDGSCLSIPEVVLDSTTGECFSAEITLPDIEHLQVNVTGRSGLITRTICAQYSFDINGHPIFNYGVATKGPLALSGNIELDGINVSVEASVFIESESSTLALSIIGNSQIAGDVSVVNPSATVYLQGGQAGIGGETGQDAIDNHVDFGVPEVSFPEPDASIFEQYITTEIDCNTDTSIDATYENVRIKANTNPSFSAQTTLNGIVFIETPNVVTFTGGAEITGIIVGDGDILDNSGDNRLIFTGNVESHHISDLPDEPQFDEIRNLDGTFIVAPGFSLSFGGSFSTLSGVISGNGIDFSGNAGGVINGTIINYSGEEMTLSGNSDLYFNHSGVSEAPAGFVPQLVMTYNPSSYTEIIN
ncbi:MAG: pilus assembly PilX N-terminal domain-containing protein [Sedimentisphaerales bacterium]|nr:pilus assembly PilX N-terminal domain-containing protein [Sedimentisphaerales bacterium]